MNHLEHQYWETKQNEADFLQLTAKIKLIQSLGFSVSSDGDHWCVMLGENPQEAIFCVYEKTVSRAVDQAIQTTFKGIKK